MGVDTITGLMVFVLVLGFLSPRLLRKTWRKLRYHAHGWYFASMRAAKASQERLTGMIPGAPVGYLRAIDGDTLEDPKTAARYRLANIDCPETDDRAKCYRARVKGEQAKGAAEMILASAKNLEIRSAGKKDRYGRTLAHIRVDGQDFGELMISRGFARRWNGARQPWCGVGGGLEILAHASGNTHQCKTCGSGIEKATATKREVIRFPVADKTPASRP